MCRRTLLALCVATDAITCTAPRPLWVRFAHARASPPLQLRAPCTSRSRIEVWRLITPDAEGWIHLPLWGVWFRLVRVMARAGPATTRGAPRNRTVVGPRLRRGSSASAASGAFRTTDEGYRVRANPATRDRGDALIRQAWIDLEHFAQAGVLRTFFASMDPRFDLFMTTFTMMNFQPSSFGFPSHTPPERGRHDQRVVDDDQPRRDHAHGQSLARGTWTHTGLNASGCRQASR